MQSTKLQRHDLIFSVNPLSACSQQNRLVSTACSLSNISTFYSESNVSSMESNLRSMISIDVFGSDIYSLAQCVTRMWAFWKQANYFSENYWTVFGNNQNFSYHACLIPTLNLLVRYQAASDWEKIEIKDIFCIYPCDKTSLANLSNILYEKLSRSHCLQFKIFPIDGLLLFT